MHLQTLGRNQPVPSLGLAVPLGRQGGEGASCPWCRRDKALTLLCQDLLGTLLQLLGMSQSLLVWWGPVEGRPSLLEQQHGQVGSCVSASQSIPARKIKLHFGRWNDVPVCEWQHLLRVRCS